MQHFGVVVAGKYKLGKQIGGGGFGEIYIGKRTSHSYRDKSGNKRRCCSKNCKPDL